jgi:O-antigen/teichoic acid export membrane protein
VALAFILQAAGTGLRTLVQVILAREMGAEEFGAYSFVLGWVTAFALVGGLGLPEALLRFVPQYEASLDWARARGVIAFARATAIVGGGLMGPIGALLLLEVRPDGVDAGAIVGGALLVPLLALLNYQTDLMRAFRSIAFAYGPFHVLRATFMIGLVVIVGMWGPGLNANGAVAAAVMALSLTVGVQAIGVNSRSRELPVAAVNRDGWSSWLRVSMPILAVGVSGLIFDVAGVLVAGFVLGAGDAGLYAAASRIALLVGFGLTAVNAVVVPMLTRLHVDGDVVRLQRFVRRVAQLSLVAGVVFGVLIVALASPLLGFFGSGFTDAEGALRILVIGQVIHASTGPVQYLLTMTGHQDQAAIARVATAVLGLAAAFALGGVWGIEGVAAATAASTIVWNGWLLWLVSRRLGVRSFAL